jgi:hypothetical protein
VIALATFWSALPGWALPVTVNGARMPSPTMPGLHAVVKVPGSVISTLSSRLRPGAMFSTSATIRSPAP